MIKFRKSKFAAKSILHKILKKAPLQLGEERPSQKPIKVYILK